MLEKPFPSSDSGSFPCQCFGEKLCISADKITPAPAESSSRPSWRRRTEERCWRLQRTTGEREIRPITRQRMQGGQKLLNDVQCGPKSHASTSTGVHAFLSVPLAKERQISKKVALRLTDRILRACRNDVGGDGSRHDHPRRSRQKQRDTSTQDGFQR